MTDIVDAIADQLLADHVGLLKENRGLRARIAELEAQIKAAQEPDIYPDEAFDLGLERIAYYAHPIPSAPAVPEWQPIETAPICEPVVVAGYNFGNPAKGRHYCIANKTALGAWEEVSEWNEHSLLQYLTHWTPLPAAPSPTEKKESME